MIRIVHLSDIHLNKESISDVENFVIKALTKDLKKFNEEKKFDLVLFSGDLVDKGGESFDNKIELALSTFEEKIIVPIKKEIGLPNDRFFFAPGNHDIDRRADEEHEDVGLTQTLCTIEKVNEKIDSKKDSGIKRILPFKEFERKFHKSFQGEHSRTNYQSCFKIKLDDSTVGITCFNSAWRCYDSKTDKGKILLGERQITDARGIIEKCDLKIAIMHHSFDWLKDFEQDYVQNFIQKDYNLLVCGHTHEGSSWTKSDIYGNIFVSIAPANWTYNIRSSDRINANGYSIIDCDLMNKKLTIYNRRYSHRKECFDPNTDLGDEGGMSIFTLLDSEEQAKHNYEIEVAMKIKDIHFEEVNEHLLSFDTDTKAPKDLESLFVLPRIVSKIEYDVNKKEEEIVYNLRNLCSNSENMLIFGTKESGKTILLDKILIELIKNIQQFHKTPVFLDFNEVGNKRFETIISHFLGVGIHQVKDFLNKHHLVLLVDNLSFTESKKYILRKLTRLISDYKNVQIIATCNQMVEGKTPLEVFDYPTFASFKTATIESFKTKEIRILMDKWFSKNEIFDTPEKLDKLLNFFLALNLPRTPLTVSMFLWIIEHQENYKPVNNATMLENFIERLFKKLSRKEIYSEEFDYRNKERLLTEIAYKMFQSNLENYRLAYADLCAFIEDYLTIRKFDFIADGVLQHFLSKSILIKEHYGRETYVRFRFNCFFQYFLTKKMDYDNDFKSYVLDEGNFLHFTNEIDYYTGLKRDQSKVLELIVDRMNAGYEEIIDLIMSIKDGFDGVFSAPSSFIETLDESFTKNLMAIEKPKDEELDKIKDEILDTIKPEKGIEKKEAHISPVQKLERLWTLAAKVLKNTEETKVANLKANSYKSILSCSMAFSSLYKFFIEDYLGKSERHVNPNIHENLMIQRKFLPLIHQLILFALMGTGKLKMIIREKIESDKTSDDISDFEKFISVFLYSDIRTEDAFEHIKKFVKSVKQSYIFDMTLFKLVSYYFLRSKSKATDRLYENLIAELIVKSKGLKKMHKDKIMKEYREKRSKIKENERL